MILNLDLRNFILSIVLTIFLLNLNFFLFQTKTIFILHCVNGIDTRHRSYIMYNLYIYIYTYTVNVLMT
jgi:hypothetical protein